MNLDLSSPNRVAMKRKFDEKQASGSKLDRISLDAKFRLKPHQKKLREERDRNKDKEKDTSQSKLDEKDTSQSMLDSVPLELKLEILIRLPAKSLAKFRCVSKMWSSITRSPEFVRSFFSISSSRPRFVVALSNGLCNSNKERLVFLFSYEEDEYSSSLVPNFDMALPCVGFSSLVGYCTSLHGFLAVEASGGLMICNPSTEQIVTLPERARYVGYDPIDNQHKAFSMSLSIRFGPIDTRAHQVLTIGQDGGWRHIEPPSTMPSYTPVSVAVSIDGFVYYGAHSPKRPMNPGIVCFHVRSEKLSYIKAPPDILRDGNESTFIEYKGKLASVVPDKTLAVPRFHRFDLWILEDVEKHEWSKKTCEIPLSVWDVVGGFKMSFPGTNKAGELIMAPTILSRNVQSFYIFYYNVETRNTRTVSLHGIGDNQEFRRSYGFVDSGECHVHISPQHIESIAFFKNPTT